MSARQFSTYQHYSGGIYLKVGEGIHTETEEELVIYICAVKGEIFCRPKAMFESTVVINGQTVPRFKPIPNGLTKDQAHQATWSL